MHEAKAVPLTLGHHDLFHSPHAIVKHLHAQEADFGGHIVREAQLKSCLDANTCLILCLEGLVHLKEQK